MPLQLTGKHDRVRQQGHFRIIYLNLRKWGTYFKALPFRRAVGPVPPHRFQISPSSVYLTPSQVFQGFHHQVTVTTVKFLIKWQTPSKNEPLRPRQWSYHKLNTAKLTALAGELNWSETTKDASIKVQWANIKSVVLSLRDKTVPFYLQPKLSPTPCFRKSTIVQKPQRIPPMRYK